jgi:hypothetical protein
MEKSLSYQNSIVLNSYKEFSVPSWDSCVANYDKGDYSKSFVDFLNYLDPNIYTQYSNPEKTIFTIPHGSAVVILKIENNHLYIETPFVKLPETKFMPILRKCAEINYSFMTLPNIKLQGDVLNFVYDMPLELCNPWKLYDVLRNITFNADKYDDEFVEKFGAVRVIEPIINNYSDGQMIQILQGCKDIAKECTEYSQHFETKRNLNSAIDCIFIGVNRIRLYCEPTGILLNKMNETIDVLYDRNNELFDKIKAGKSFFKYVEEINQYKFKDYCAITFSLIPDKKSVNRKYIEEWIEGHLNNAESSYNAEDYSTAALYGYYALYYAVAYFNIDGKDRKVIEYGLRNAANKTWKEASESLNEVMNHFFQNTGKDFVFKNSSSSATAGFDTGSYMKTIEESVSQYKSIMSGFMSAFTGKK